MYQLFKENFPFCLDCYAIVSIIAVNIVALFSFYANVLKIKRIKRYHVKGIGSSLLISINIDQETEK